VNGQEERVRKAWGITGRIAIIGILTIVAILAVQSRTAVVEACRDRNIARLETAEARRVQRAFIDAAADARVTSGRRNPDLVVAESDLATAAFYRSLIRRTTVPRAVECPTFWHN